MKAKAFLFDLDGTLIDTERTWGKAMLDMIVAHGGRATLAEIMPNVIGRNWLDIHQWLHEAYPALGNSTAMQDAIELRKFYTRRATDPRSMRIQSSIDFFLSVSSLAPCAIVSGSPRDDVEDAAQLCGIRERTSLILGAGEYEAGKPSPSGYLKAAKLLGVNPEDCVVVEDSTVGVASGVAAGMNVIALDRGNAISQTYDGAKWRVKSLADIDIIKEFAT